MSKDNSNDKTYSLSEIEKKLQDAMEAVEILKKGGNISVGGDSIVKKYDELKKQFDQKSADYKELDEQLQQLTQEVLELRQEKMMFEKFTTLTEAEKDEMKKTRDEMKQKYETERQTALEQEQEKMFMEKSLQVETKEKEKAKMKYYKTIIVSVLAIAVVTGGYSILFAELAGQQYRVDDLGGVNSSYEIQNLKGDIIDTWLSWRLHEGDPLRVTIQNGENYPPEILEAVKQTIISEIAIDIDDSLAGKGERGETSEYFLGWKGALLAAAEAPSEVYIPTIELIDTENGADIIVILVDEQNADGFTGWTVSIADDAVNQVLKSKVTIFNVDELSQDQVAAITRHEFGHVIGLVHSSDELDLMHPVIKTQFPFISECNIAAVHHLYDGGKSSKVVCEK